jgi:glycine cleavage system H protein
VGKRKPARGAESETRPAETVLRFTAEHLWVRAEGQRAQVGVSDYGQDDLGEVISIELPEIGENIERDAPFAELESVRTVQELRAPVSGTVVAVNPEIDDHPELINEDPYHDGWLIEVKLDDEAELDDLMPADAYEDSVSSEEV